jgi:hypothetical protein
MKHDRLAEAMLADVRAKVLEGGAGHQGGPDRAWGLFCPPCVLTKPTQALLSALSAPQDGKFSKLSLQPVQIAHSSNPLGGPRSRGLFGRIVGFILPYSCTDRTDKRASVSFVSTSVGQFSGDWVMDTSRSD